MSERTNPFGVPAHRHTNPDGSEGGWVANTANVDCTSYVGRNARVSGNAWVSGNALVHGNAWVSSYARVYDPRHVLTVGPIGSENQYATLARTETGHTLTIGCWQDGTLDTLKAEVMKRAPQCWPEYKAARALLRLRAAEWDTERTEATA